MLDYIAFILKKKNQLLLSVELGKIRQGKIFYDAGIHEVLRGIKNFNGVLQNTTELIQ